MNWPWKRRRQQAPEPAIRSKVNTDTRSPADRARMRLLQSLTYEQLRTYVEDNYFDVEALDSGRTYRIFTRSIISNVTCLNTGLRYCCQLDSCGYPIADHHLAQALMLRYAEKDFLRIARR